MTVCLINSARWTAAVSGAILLTTPCSSRTTTLMRGACLTPSRSRSDSSTSDATSGATGCCASWRRRQFGGVPARGALAGAGARSRCRRWSPGLSARDGGRRGALGTRDGGIRAARRDRARAIPRRCSCAATACSRSCRSSGGRRRWSSRRCSTTWRRMCAASDRHQPVPEARAAAARRLGPLAPR